MTTYNFGYNASKKRKKKLSHLRRKGFFKNQKPGTFRLETSQNWGKDNDSKLLLGLFSYFYEEGIIWEEGRFEIDKDNERFVRPLIHAVINTMKIFKNMSLDFCFHRHITQLSDLCPGLASNTFIQELSITYTGKKSEKNFLPLNNLLQTNAPCLQTLDISLPLDYRWILPGLRDNRTLKTIDFYFPMGTTDANMSAIVVAIARNPNLESLTMHFGTKDIGDLTAEAFKTLLTNSTSLRELNLGSSGKKMMNAECIIQGLKTSRSLKRLEVGNVLTGDLRFTKLFRILPDCPLLECIRLHDSDSDNPILNGKDLAQVELLPRLPRPIELDAPSIPLRRLVELLRCHPEVRMPHISFYSFAGARRAHLFHMNSHGRYLLDRPNAPLSIWPLVLEKVNRNKRVKDKSSVIYELLHGPAGCGRTIIFSKCLPHFYPRLESYSIVTCHETSFDVFIRDVKDFEELLEMKEDGIFQNQEQGKFQNRKPWKFKIEFNYDEDDDDDDDSDSFDDFDYWEDEEDDDDVEKLNEDHSKSFLEIFSYFHEKGIIWEKGIFEIDKDNERFVRPLIHAVTNTMKIFKNMSLDFCFHRHITQLSDLCPGLASNTFIQKLSIKYTGKSSKTNFLPLNNLLQTNAPCLQTLCISLSKDCNLDYRWILPGLRDNRTLKTIEFYFPMGTTDETMSAIVAAIARNPNLGRNPNLETLRVYFDSRQIGDLTSEAFKTLLTNCTSLRELRLFSGEHLNAECIIQGLKNSPSLKFLDLSDMQLHGDLFFARLFRILPDCPLIERIGLCNFFSEEDLVQVKLLPRLPRPIEFHMDLESDINLFPKLRFSMEHITELLRCHPEVRMFIDMKPDDACYPSDRPYFIDSLNEGREFAHALFMNWHGRYLLDRPNVPISIWPLVLEKVNDNKAMYEDEQANVIYELLHRPAGFGRTSF